MHDPADQSSVYYDDSVLKRALEKAGIDEREFWDVLKRGELRSIAMLASRILEANEVIK